MVLEQFGLTTIENIYNPFDDFIKWYFEDIRICNKYGINDCCSKLANETIISNALSLKEQFEEDEKTIDRIIVEDPLNIYKKISRKIEINPTKYED